MGIDNSKTSRKINIILLGLESSGKTFFLFSRVKQLIEVGGEIKTKPTEGFNYEEIRFDSMEIAIWDLPGKESLRSFWPIYYKNIAFDGIIYLIDYDNKTTLDESIKVLHEIVVKEEFSECSIIIFVNRNIEDCIDNNDDSSDDSTKENNNEMKSKEFEIDEIKKVLYFDIIPQINKDIFIFDLFEKRKPGDKQFELENRFREFLATFK